MGFSLSRVNTMGKHKQWGVAVVLVAVLSYCSCSLMIGPLDIIICCCLSEAEHDKRTVLEGLACERPP